MNYIEIDFTEIKGFDSLSGDSKKLFQQIYKSHNSIQGNEYKKDYIPVEVTEEEGKFKVRFSNKEWLYYFSNGTWG